MQKREFLKYLPLGTAFMLSPQLMSFDSNSSTRFQPLKAGDTIALITPGSALREGQLEKSIKNVSALGLKYKLGKNVGKKYGYLAGKDEERLEDLHWAFENKKTKAVWCLRGGYGCSRLLPHIDYKLLKSNPKPLIGYSDITALHLALMKKLNWPSFHGPVMSSEGNNFNFTHIRNVLFYKEWKSTFQPYHEHEEAAYTLTSGQAIGKLVGGNLSLLAALSGTSFIPSFKNKLVFIEEIGEKPYRIDRMLTQLIQTSDLDKSAGIILGQFTDCENENATELKLKACLEFNLKKLSIPCYFGASIGHVDYQWTLPLNTYARMDADQKSLELLENPLG